MGNREKSTAVYHLLKFKKKIEKYKRDFFFFFKNPYIPKDTLQISYNGLSVGEEDNGRK